MDINIDEILTTVTELVTVYGIKILAALAIFIIGRFIAGLIAKGVERGMTKSKVEESLVGFSKNLAYAALLTFVIIAALGQLGIQTTSFVAIVGAAGLAIGLALQGSLSNFASGVLILIFKPYKIGDYVCAGGGEGVVKDIGIFTTTVLTLDNRTQIIPNSAAMGGA